MRQWHPTSVFLPGKSHGQRSLVGYSPWGRWELDTTEWLHFHFHALEKEMATHSSVLAWRIPGTGEPSRLPSMRSHGVRHDWSDLAAAAAALFCYQLHSYTVSLASLVAQIVKNLPAMQETRVQSLGWEDAGEGNGNPLQYSCLDNPMDRGAWQATVHGVANSQT